MIVQKLVIFLTFVWEGACRLRTYVHINDFEINIQNSRRNLIRPRPTGTLGPGTLVISGRSHVQISGFPA